MRVLKVLGVLAITISGMSSRAQMPNPYGAPISLEDAKKAAVAALTTARKNHWTMAVAVVDPSGNLVYYEKMDNTQLGSADVAIDKARSSALYKRPTKAFQDGVEKGGVELRVFQLRGGVSIDGGIPLIADGKIVGAIGVSGDTAANDGACAKTGADVIK
jgi:uncharacterized protein GlcG (DUF336 family)